jgi:hypothetical protein
LGDGVGRRAGQVAAGGTVQTASAGNGGRVGRILALGPRDGEHSEIDGQGDKSAKSHKGDGGQRQDRATRPLRETGASNVHEIVPWQRQRAWGRLVDTHRLPPPDENRWLLEKTGLIRRSLNI